MIKKKSWSPIRFTCSECNQVIYALVPGDVDTCDCWDRSLSTCESLIISKGFRSSYDEDQVRHLKQNVYGEFLKGFGVYQTKNTCQLFGNVKLASLLPDER